MNDEEIKVSELDLADEIRDTDQIMIVQGGINKKVIGEKINDRTISDSYGTSEEKGYSQKYQNEHNVIVSSTQPTTSERVWFKKSKNLFSSSLELGTFSNEGVKSASTTNYRNATPIQVQPNTTYTFSINGVSQKYALYYYNNTNTFINSEGLTTGTFTTPANCYYINFRCFNADFTSDYANLKLQIEEGSTATAYEPYIVPSINVDGEEIYNKNVMNYSTAEQVIGKWTDGKPLYRKVIKLTTTQNNDTKTYDLTSLSISEIKHIYGATHFSGYTRNLYNTYAANGTVTEFTGVYIGGNTLTFKSYNSNSGATFYGNVEIIIEYTKTTD